MQAVVRAPTVALPAAAEPRPLPPAGVDPAPVLAARVAAGGTAYYLHDADSGRALPDRSLGTIDAR